MSEEPEQTEQDDQPAGGTDGPGSVAIDEPTQPAMKESDRDEFDKQADEQEAEQENEQEKDEG